MQTLLLPFFDDDASENALSTALLLAQRFGSHVEGLFVEETPQIIGGEGITLPPEYLNQLELERTQRSHHAKARFLAALGRHGLTAGEFRADQTGISAGWTEQEGQEAHVVGEDGRLFDLIVIARSLKLAAGGWEVSCEAALFDSGRPVLVAAQSTATALGEMVVIAWNGSTETARTIALARPILAHARDIVVLTVEGAVVPGPSGAQVAAHLCRNGLPARSLEATRERRDPGAAILYQAERLGADLLIKGAYTHSRLRQLIFGGATRHILSEARLPVLLAH